MANKELAKDQKDLSILVTAVPDSSAAIPASN